MLAGAELYLSALGMGLGLVLVLAMFELYHLLLLGVFIGRTPRRRSESGSRQGRKLGEEPLHGHHGLGDCTDAQWSEALAVQG